MSTLYKRSKLVLDAFCNLAGRRAHQATTAYNGKHVEDLNSFGRVFKKTAVFSGLAIVAFSPIPVEKNYFTGKIHFVLVPRFVEKKLGEWKIEKIKEEYKVDVLPPEHPHTMRVRLIAMNMTESPILRPPCSYLRQYLPKFVNSEVIVIDRPILKACCYAGKIVIFTGLLDRLDSDAEIATVIGHEVGHDFARHAAVKITKVPWLACRDLFIWCVSNLYGINCEDIKHHGFRKIEREADYIGGLLMASAGYDPSVAPTVYARLSEDMVLSDNCSPYPTGKKRAELLSRPGVMEKLMCEYNKNSARSITVAVTNVDDDESGVAEGRPAPRIQKKRKDALDLGGGGRRGRRECVAATSSLGKASAAGSYRFTFVSYIILGAC